MRRCVVLTDEQPPGVHGKLPHKCGNDVDQKRNVNDVTPLADDRLEERVVDRLRQGGSALVEEGRRFLCKLSARDLLDCRKLHELAASRSTCASAGK